MIIIFNILFIWVTIGFVINLFSEEKIPFSKDFNANNRINFWFDILLGPIAIILFIMYLNDQNNNDEL